MYKKSVAMKFECSDVELIGILDSDLYLYPEVECSERNYGLFTIMLDANTNFALLDYFVDADLTVPVHIWSAEILHYLAIRIKKGRPIAIRGKISMFGDRLLVSINNTNDITFMHSSVWQTVIRPHNDNKNRQKLALACREEDRFMATFKQR